jgi:ribonuclease HII
MKAPENITGIALTVGCDEAGRGCLAGPVVAGAVILPVGYSHPELNDSKKLSGPVRVRLSLEIARDAVAYGIGIASVEEIDRFNILQASIIAMHRAIKQMNVRPEHILVDGNRFNPMEDIPHDCIIGGDAKISAIAAASIMAKTFRDRFMEDLHQEYPLFSWCQNKGYPTRDHIEAVRLYGRTPYHRRSFAIRSQLLLPLDIEFPDHSGTEKYPSIHGN